MEHEYFNKSTPVTLILDQPSKNSDLLTFLRTEGDKRDQFVTSIRYRDLLSWNGDRTKISIWTLEDQFEGTIWSSYHSKCEYCLDFEKRYRENLIHGIRIYPRGMYPPKRDWIKFDP